jgi:hypothetical protein
MHETAPVRRLRPDAVVRQKTVVYPFEDNCDEHSGKEICASSPQCIRQNTSRYGNGSVEHSTRAMADRRQGLRGRGNGIPLSSADPSYRANCRPISLLANSMEEGTKSKKTVFVGGIADDVDENAIYEAFSTFGRHAILAL